MADNDCFYNPSSDEHWEAIYGFCKSIRRRMVEVPGGDVNIAGKVFHVGTFKIARTMVSVSDWAKVMGLDNPALERRPMTGVTWREIHNFYQHLKILASLPGQLTFPTEAQLVLARQRGLIKTQNDYREFCFTEFRSPDKMGNHHFGDNLPEQEPFNLVVRSGDIRSFMPYTDSHDRTGFRMALVDYKPMANEDIEQLLRLAGIPE